MGAGAWGTALAKVLADAGNNVALWARRPELADEINDTRRNTRYLGDTELPKSIRATSDPAEALAGACTVLLAVPSQTMRANLERWTDLIRDDVTLVSLAKGIELDTLMRMSQVVVQVTGADPSRVAAITGPVLRACGQSLARPVVPAELRGPWTSSSSNSPTKAKTINKYLGDGYQVLPSYGHVRDLPEKDGSVLPDEDFRIIYEALADRKKRVDEIARALKDGAKRLILATDPDREGEAISWHLLELLKAQQGAQRASTSSAWCSTRSPSPPCSRRCATAARPRRRT